MSDLRDTLAELVAAITAHDAFPVERVDTPFGEAVSLLENPRITAALLAARTALHTPTTSTFLRDRAVEECREVQRKANEMGNVLGAMAAQECAQRVAALEEPARGTNAFLGELLAVVKKHHPHLTEETRKAMAADMQYASRFLGLASFRGEEG
jgi:hypothetical protein